MPLKLTDIFKGSSEEEILKSLENFRYNDKTLKKVLINLKKKNKN